MKYSISRQNSVQTTADLSAAFLSGTAGADSLEIGAGAYLRAGGQDAAGALLDNSYAWTVQVDGTIRSEKFEGVRLQGGNVEASSINVGSEGEIFGAANGIQALSSVTIKNRGMIQAVEGNGIVVQSEDANRLVNKGLVGGEYSFNSYGADSIDRVKNAGEMIGSITLNGGDDQLINSGKIAGTSTNSSFNLGDGDDRLINSGTIKLEITDTHGADTLQNRGLIDSNVLLGDGDDTFTNHIATQGGRASGIVTGKIDLGEGDDRLEGGAGIEFYHDSSGADTANLDGGDDIYFAVGLVAIDGEDRIDGGKGVDTYDASTAVDPLIINLDRVSHSLPAGSSLTEIAAETAKGSSVAEGGSDLIKGFENVLGGIESDVIFGSEKNNFISGGEDNDRLNGEGGNDTLIGGSGIDYLTGGEGKDHLTGGGEFDMFVFSSLADSGAGASTRDVITDFEGGLDNINFDRIDANADTAGDDMFEFIGMNASFSGSAGELRAAITKKGVIVEGDVNGDSIADFSVLIADPSVVLQTSDFEL